MSLQDLISDFPALGDGREHRVAGVGIELFRQGFVGIFEIHIAVALGRFRKVKYQCSALDGAWLTYPGRGIGESAQWSH